MRLAPPWLTKELTRIGGVNPYGEPVFRLVWAPTERQVIGWKEDNGLMTYRNARAVHGEPCWALMVWEPRELYGSPEAWEWSYGQHPDGYVCGGYPKYGRYRLLQRFIHKELVNGRLRTYRMEPCGFLLDIMLPMLMMWRKLSNEGKTAALKQEERLKKEEWLKKVKDARDGCRVSRGSQLVQKRAELIEKGLKQAMAIAAQTGLGMRIES